MNRSRSAFTLIELLVVIAILAVLIALVMLAVPSLTLRSKMSASLNNMRQVGAGFQLYANDNDFNLPSRIMTADKWPALLAAYLKDTKVYADPGDPRNFLRLHRNPLSNAPNNTSYIMNGFNDVGAYDNEQIHVKLSSIEKPSETVLLANQSGTGHFYMDLDEGNQNSGVLRTKVYKDGANYLFVDGSVRFLQARDVGEELWLVHKTPGR